MSVYENSDELIKDAINKKYIKLSSFGLRIGSLDIDMPNVVNILNFVKWKAFLEDVAKKSTSDNEIAFVASLLSMLKETEIKMQEKVVHKNKEPDKVKKSTMPRKINKTISEKITEHEVEYIKESLNECNTIDDVLNFMSGIPKTIKWKRPIIQDGKLRYYSDDITWYIEEQNGYYSIFNLENKEVARYDKLKDAKDNMHAVIKYFANI